MLPVRKCGDQGFECAAQGLGCVGMSAFYKGFEGDESRAESIRVIEKASAFRDLMLDTADMYGPFTNEQLVGEAIADKKGKFKIATKCGAQITPNGRNFDSSPSYVKRACQASLDRLGVDCIDLYYLHRYDRKTPIEDTMRAFKELVEEGKVKYVGVSEINGATLRKAHAVCPITAYQMEWSLFTRDVEEELVPTCRELGIGIVAYSPLGRGFLTGSIKSIDDIPEGDCRRFYPRFNEHLGENLKLVQVIEKIAAERDCTPGQVALAWIHAQGEDVFPIPGTKKVHRFEENIAALSVKLTDDDMKKLGEIASKTKGKRLPEHSMNWTFETQSKPESETFDTICVSDA